MNEEDMCQAYAMSSDSYVQREKERIAERLAKAKLLATFTVGDKVRKLEWRKTLGTIVADFTTTTGERRLVVDIGDDLLYIFPPQQLERVEEQEPQDLIKADDCVYDRNRDGRDDYIGKAIVVCPTLVGHPRSFPRTVFTDIRPSKEIKIAHDVMVKLEGGVE